MSTQPDSIRHLEAGLNRYREARRSDKKRGLFGLTPWLQRLIRESKEYPRLRASDTAFLYGAQCELREVIDLKGISVDELEDYAVLLTGHQSALDERSRSLAFIPLMLVALAALAAAAGTFTTSSDSLAGCACTAVALPASVAFLVAMMIVLALVERVQIQGWTPIYHEYLLLVEREARRMRRGDA